MQKQNKKLKQIKKKKNTNRRKMHGGNSETMRSLASIKANTQMILADINRIEDEGDENCDLTEIKRNAIQDSVLIRNLIEEQQNADSEEKNPLDQVITTDGFTGTIGELLSKIREKISKLSHYNNDGHAQTIAHLNSLLDTIASESVNVNNIKEILKGGRIKFKSNRLIATKTKKKQNKKTKKIINHKRRKIQTKRR